jgi:hypothetical protein
MSLTEVQSQFSRINRPVHLEKNHRGEVIISINHRQEVDGYNGKGAMIKYRPRGSRSAKRQAREVVDRKAFVCLTV